ncbi:hypothetical protein ACTFR8_23905 [Bacillus cereus group sp. MYBK15-3]|uniref:hypothetical protein n=1 Tax=Bacillus cereus group TaxID=86661 RepID=UPI00187998D6|nr:MULTISPECIES: hypothetical protein [Bacillus cereus group]MBE7114331.1 hypothetical protein [Bacillus paranthracis]MBE7154796.1 hypothetical protein [Bacillus paranthracis]MBX9158644.1 hypothetical protein [Bacillus cereus]
MFKSQEQLNKVLEILKDAGFSRAKCDDYRDWTFFFVGRNEDLQFVTFNSNDKGFEVGAVGMRIHTAEESKKYGEELLFLAGVMEKLNKVMSE